MAKVTFKFKRRSTVSIIQTFLPCTVFVCASWIPFYIHKNCASSRISKFPYANFPLVCILEEFFSLFTGETSTQTFVFYTCNQA